MPRRPTPSENMYTQHLPFHRELRQGKIMVEERKYSSRVVDGIEQAPSRAMLYPTDSRRKTSASHKLESPRCGAW